jgi:zinc resistance-associated protein
MRRVILGMAAAAGLAAAGLGATAMMGASAAERGREFAVGPERGWARFSPEDRQAFTDARIAALHAGLKLNAEQERLWPPVETAIRDLAKVRREQREARRARGGREAFERDLPGALRGMADAGTARSDALRRLADATAPLYATLDEGQKRRALVLARPGGRHGVVGRPGGPGGRHGGPHHGRDE